MAEESKPTFTNLPEPTPELISTFVRSLKFSEEVVPKLVESRAYNYVLNGANHSYPIFLNSLRSKNGLFNSIILGTSQSIAGEGLIIEDADKHKNANRKVVEEWLKKVNKEGESAHDLIKKLSLDLTTFGYCFIQIVKTKEGFDLYHTDATHVALGKISPETKRIENFWISNDWSQLRKEENKPVSIQAYDELKKDTYQLIMLRQYVPGNMYYNEPRYAACIKHILIHDAIGSFHLSNIKNGMIPSMWISFCNGVPKKEVEEKIYDDITESFAGEKQAGKAIFTYSNSRENAPEITMLNPSDADKLFLLLGQDIRQEILCSNQAPAILFSISTPGAMGQRNEAIALQQIWFNRVVAPEQIIIENEFNKLCKLLFGIDDMELIIQDSNPLSFSFDDNTLVNANILSKSELRQMIGYEPIDEEKSSKPVALIEKIGIGGTQSLLTILTSTLSDEQKINTLTIVFGISLEEAQSLVTTQQTPSVNDQFKNN